MEDVKAAVSNYYGKQILKTQDLAYDACCVAEYDDKLTANLTEEVLEKRYGCGSPIPDALQGTTVLDLGCGAGADCYMAAQLVGEGGLVIGVDMTDEQLEVAKRNIAPHMDRFGFSKPNVEFRKGFIEEIPAEDDSVDVVISNCVINLSQNKQKVFDEIWRVLKPGGEFYIADIVADRRVPDRLQADTTLWSECLTGAAYSHDLRRIMAKSGFEDVRTVSSRWTNDIVEGIRFASRTMRGFKLPLEDRCEDYGQVAVYRGTLDGPTFTLDDHHVFEAGVAMRVCKNTADMLSASRLAAHFEVSSPMSHLGVFDCEPAPPIEVAPAVSTPKASSGCC